MIDTYFKQEQLLQAGHDEFWLAIKSASAISRLWYEEFGVPDMIDTIKRFGEDEDDCGHRIWLSNLNNMCNINGHTDIMSAVACKNTAGEDCLSIQVNTPDDMSTIFVSIDDFNYEVADVIYDQIINYKK